MCEIGCGDGKHLMEFARAGFDVLGVEPDSAAREAGSGHGLQVLDGTLEHLPPELEQQSFELVLLSHVLEHCLDVHRAIENLRGLLAPDGLLIVETPNHACLGYRRNGASWAFTDAPRHLNFFTPKSLEDALESHALRVVETEFVGYCRQFSCEWLEAERKTREVLAPGAARTGSMRNKLAAWTLLARTAFAEPERKYDSVRLTLSAAGTQRASE